MSAAASDVVLGPLDRTRRGEAVLGGIGPVHLPRDGVELFWRRSCGGAPFNAGGGGRWPIGDPHAVIPLLLGHDEPLTGREINNHVFPYLSGRSPRMATRRRVCSSTVLSGMLMWRTIGAHTDRAFFIHW